MTTNLTYNKALGELEKIVKQIESEEIQLDTLSEKIKRATELIEFCKTKLRTTEEEFEKSRSIIG
ncbi:MAG: exodeoxyribonuclease VII small subunit [Bacteroidales bacterium]|nr:exodeoxyribonuclease VII small subunit [Bacteroidales bacterium]